MAEAQKHLRELDCANLSVDWKNWKRDFLVYMIANNKNAQPEATKIAIFLWLIGTKGANIYNTLFPNDGSQNSLLGTVTNQRTVPAEGDVAEHTVDEVTQRTLEAVLKKFDDHCFPQKNVTMESYKFNNIVQKERQTFNEFLTELRIQLERCDFACSCGIKYEDRMLRDRIITGVFDKKLQLKLLDGRDETLQRVLDICKTFESANANKGILEARKPTIAAISSTNNDELDSINAINRRFCFNCGGDWKPDHKSSCPAKEYTCSCGKKGHFNRMCRRSKAKANAPDVNSKDKPKVNRLWSDYKGDLHNIKYNKTKVGHKLSIKNYIYRINSIGRKSKQWIKAYQMGKDLVKFKIDTGSDFNCIPLKVVIKLNIKMSNEHNDFPVFDYSNNKVKIFGTVKLNLFDTKSKTDRMAEFIVVDDAFEPILGLDTSIEFGLVKRIDLVTCSKSKEVFVKENSDVFNGLGKIPEKITIHLKENSKPVVHYRKRFPDTIIKKLQPKLEKMVQDGIISPVSHPTDWVNNLQVVEKPNGDLRICLDPKPLNACIKREHFQIPTINSLTSEISDKRIFTVFDCSNGFWQLELDEKSSELTTFMTPFGRYKFNRLPFGLNCAPEIFQRTMIKIFGDIPGVIVYFDDIGIVATDEDEHDKILAIVLERARMNNVKFNGEKIQYRKSEINFMGHILSNGMIRPADKHINAILQIQKPTDKQGVLRLLGLIKYLARFVPTLSKITAELRNLTTNNVEFSWNEKHDAELETIKQIMTRGPVLKAFDPSLPIVIQTDASGGGLGSSLLQDDLPVAFVSRTLTKCEQRWAQIEKELLAVVFACERFHYYIYGRDFVVHSDHKPLETLVKKEIDDVTPRLQRMFMMLLKYPSMEIVYKPGKSMLIADCLSRAQLPDACESEELAGVIHAVARSACVSEDNYNYYRQILEMDENLKRVCKFVTGGWPRYHQLDEFCQKFHKLKSNLHFEHGLLFVDHKLVIPAKLQGKIAKWLHDSHFGIEKTLARARKLYFWPGMNTQLKEMIASCNICEKFKRNNQKEPLIQEQNPKYPYHIVSMDLFEYAGRNFIAIIDAYSNYLVAAGIDNKTSGHIIDIIVRVFNKIGYPSRIKCDNSPFNSAEFEKFARRYNIQFTYSSPRYAQSNGLAEKGVAIAKNILKRCYETNSVDQFQYRILEYNTTPIASMQLSPSEMFFGRLVKTGLPVSDQLLVRNNLSESVIQEKIDNKKEKQKYYYDRNAKSLQALRLGDLVIFKKNGKEWHYGKIVGIVNDRSYIIKDAFDYHFRRNRRFIARTKNEDFSASDLMYEENVKSSNLDNLPEIQIVKPSDNVTNEMQNGQTNDVIVNEPELPAEEQYDYLSSEYETAGGESSEASSDSEAEMIAEPIIEDNTRRTRSGRAIRPPQRYGW